MKVLKRLTIALLATTLFACGGNDEQFKVGVMAGPEADLMIAAANKAKLDSGLEVEVVEFSDYISPNVALADGSINVNAFQHQPYLDSMVRDRGFALESVGTTFVYPIGGYSKTIKSLEELADGAQIAIPNDPTNEARALLLLDLHGLITLDDRENLEATPANIVSNPKGLKFIELDAAQLARSLDDVTLAFINSTYSVPADLLPTRDAIIVEGAESPYVNLMVARQDNAKDPRIAQLLKAYQSDEVKAKAEALFKGAAVASW